MKKIFFLIVAILSVQFLSAQSILDRVKNRTKAKVNQKIDEKIDKAVSKPIDEADDAVSGKNKKNNSGSGDTNNGASGEDNGGNNNSSKGAAPGTLKSYSKFDFVPGEKIVASEDFSQDAIGDFPAKWNTNSTGEVVTIDGKSGKWLMLNKEGVFYPEFVTNLPENFTFECDLACNKDFSFYSSAFHIAFAQLKNPTKEFNNWKTYGSEKNGTQVWAHPQDAGGSRGHSGFLVWSNNASDMKNEASTYLYHGKSGKNFVHVSIWRQKNRLRMYLDAEKVWDVPRGFESDKKYNTVLFSLGGFHVESDRYYVSNVRIAVGAPDTRNKLITEGKFVTHGILFDVNSDKIKPESYGALKDIATVLSENADVKVKIVGHTDADGDDKSNLDLSKRRAEAVKNVLSKEFSISDSRMTTEGKGESQPIDNNTSPEGKANNRRVEFIKT